MENWLKGIIQRPVTVGMITIAAFTFGALSLGRLPIELLPDITYPTLTVQTELPDASPQEVEQIASWRSSRKRAGMRSFSNRPFLLGAGTQIDSERVNRPGPSGLLKNMVPIETC